MKLAKHIFLFLSSLWARVFGSSSRSKPEKFGKGPHDCALVALYAVVPNIPEDEIVDAFTYCAENWPYGGVTNKEFSIAAKYLKLKFEYDDSDGQTIRGVALKKSGRYVALLHGHYIAMEKGEIIGEDGNIPYNPETEVYCSWKFS